MEFILCLNQLTLGRGLLLMKATRARKNIGSHYALLPATARWKLL